MELSKFEKRAINRYLSAIEPHTEGRSIIIKCRESVIALIISILIDKYKYTENSADCKSNTAFNTLVYHTDFFGKKDENGNTESNQGVKRIRASIENITKLRNYIEHDGDEEGMIDISEDDINDSKVSCLSSLTIVLKWYLNVLKKYNLTNISNLDSDEKRKLDSLFTKRIFWKEEIIEKETYYVVLLIDSSESMLFHYLNDKNKVDRGSTDYKEAIKKVQNAMQTAHEKALNALRSSANCRQGKLKIFQYTFNHDRKWLNDPETLSTSPHGEDKVKKITAENYYPSGMTALYDVVEESLKVVYEKYLKRTEETTKDIDKLIIGIITDGEDTIVNGEKRYKNGSNEDRDEYKRMKSEKLKKIAEWMQLLDGKGIERKRFLESSVIIGLTGDGLKETELNQIRKELNFHFSISILKDDEQSIRKAFKLWSTNAMNI